MPELDFPNDQYPAIGQTYTGGNGVVYTYDGTKWIGQGPISNKGPTGPAGADSTVPGPTGPSGYVNNSVIYTFDGYSQSTNTSASSVFFDSYDNTSTTVIKLTTQDTNGFDTFEWWNILANTAGSPIGLLQVVDVNDQSKYTIFNITTATYVDPFYELNAAYVTGNSDLITATNSVYVGYVKNGTSVQGDVIFGGDQRIAVYEGDGTTITARPEVFFNTFSNRFQIGDGQLANANFGIIRTEYSLNQFDGMLYSQTHDTPDVNNFNFYRARGTTSNPEPITAGDDVGEIGFFAAYDTGSGIVSYAAGVITVSVIDSPSLYPESRMRFAVNNGTIPYIGAELSGTGTWKITSLGSLGSVPLYVNTQLAPGNDNTITLGTSTTRWKDLYLGTGSIYINDHTLRVNDLNELEVDGQAISFTTNVLVNGIYTATLDTSGTLLVDGGLVVNGEITAQKLTIELTTVTTTEVTTDDVFTILNPTNSTSTDSGALIISGGAGLGGNLYIGGNLSVAGEPVDTATISNWNTAYGWGDHSTASYLITETDPVFLASTASSISSTDVSNWNTAYGWGDHSTASYLTAETDPVFLASTASGITTDDLTNWNTAYGWGDHSTASYLITETDPVFLASTASGITAADITNWDSAYTQIGQLSQSIKLTQTQELFTNTTIFTDVVDYDCSTGHIFNHDSVGNNFIVNLTNLTLDTYYATNVTLIIQQGALAYLSTGLQIGGVTQTVNWQGSGSAPSGTPTKKDIVNFSIMSTGTATTDYLVFGQLVSFG